MKLDKAEKAPATWPDVAKFFIGWSAAVAMVWIVVKAFS